MLGLCRFCLYSSEFGYVTKIFYVPSFFYVSKKLRKNLGHRKMSVLVFLLHKISKKQGKNEEVPTFFYVFLKKNIEKVWDIEKSWDSVIFCLHFYVTEIFYVPNFF